jgi:tripartite-type tricarboxylate transporter receptor subunit TctC
MKKALIALLILSSSLSTYAKESISIVWPFSPGSTQAGYLRAIIDEANAGQSNFKFTFEHKPGAGGAVGAKHILASSNLSLLSSSSSFFTRPIAYPTESHNTNDFKPILMECTGSPVVVVSSKFKTFDDLKKQKRITIGANLGSITEAVAKELGKNLPGVKLDVITYSNTLIPTQDVMKGELDLNVDFMNDTKQWVESGKLNIVGITGTTDFPKYNTFKSQGITGFEDMSASFQIVAPKRINESLAKDIHGVLNSAAIRSEKVKSLMKADNCVPSTNLTYEETTKVFNKLKDLWPAKLKAN